MERLPFVLLLPDSLPLRFPLPWRERVGVRVDSSSTFRRVKTTLNYTVFALLQRSENFLLTAEQANRIFRTLRLLVGIGRLVYLIVRFQEP